MKRVYKVVDVFTSRPLLGNPVAVVLDSEGLATEDMQAIARWTNLSETTFVLPPSSAAADFLLRIFTPRGELPFAGHPTLGSAHALLEAGRVTPRQDGRLVQECKVGLIDVSVKDRSGKHGLAFNLPKASFTAIQKEDLDELERILGRRIDREVAPAIVDVGAVWIVACLESSAAVLQLKPDLARLSALSTKLKVIGITLFGAHEQGAAGIEVRTFAPAHGVDEDPVCGSGNGCVAAFHWERGLLGAGGGKYTASQGRCIGRNGLIDVAVDAQGVVQIGGDCVTCVDGIIAI
ncbi:PhzF family phenazine biosynthesis protein [Aestuariivirga litoralis]|uniref:PhzF family phenazine biosynthesis protein n=1 Tax=Aestuariivirga litoralis TaxID=2650924 RepID=UPI0018C69107|nr:PhzF family phenazine biosynthesis protein [Aestuariivirga litoralis]MBG1233810.1 PhzF family phenazine biosynthesis protein [Aestuariivirga litoralis]